MRAERDRSVRRVRLGRPRRRSASPSKTLCTGLEAGPAHGPGDGARAGRLALPAPAFIPLAEGEGGAGGGAPAAGPGAGGAGAEAAEADAEPGESHEVYLLRRTRELNAAVRARPHDLQLWLDFANFQDEAAQCACAAPAVAFVHAHCVCKERSS